MGSTNKKTTDTGKAGGVRGFVGTHYSIKSPVPCNYFSAILASRLQEGVRSTLALTVTSHGHSSVTRLDVRGSLAYDQSPALGKRYGSKSRRVSACTLADACSWRFFQRKAPRGARTSMQPPRVQASNF